jgi:hypothetical protein
MREVAVAIKEPGNPMNVTSASRDRREGGAGSGVFGLGHAAFGITARASAPPSSSAAPSPSSASLSSSVGQAQRRMGSH